MVPLNLRAPTSEIPPAQQGDPVVASPTDLGQRPAFSSGAYREVTGDLGQCARMYWSSLSRYRRLSQKAHSQGMATLGDVILLPGVWEDRYFLDPIAAELMDAGYRVHSVPGLRLMLARVELLADRVRRYLDQNELSHVMVVAHSKGGLVGKQLLIDTRSQHLIAGVIALCTPWHGSSLTTCAPGGLGLRSLRPNSPMIKSLGRHRKANARIVSIYSRQDSHIPEGSRLAGAQANVELECTGHYRPLANPDAMEEVLETLAGWRKPV